MVFHDNEFNNKPGKNGAVSYIVISLISAIIGGLLVSFFALGLKAPNTTPNFDKQNTGGKQTPIVSVPSGGSANIPEIAKNLGPAVVGVTNRGNVSNFSLEKSVESGSGSGVIFDPAGYIVTNNHVVKDASELIVTLANGKQVKAKLVGTDPRTDLAVLKINADNLTVARFGDSDKTQVGEPAIAIGNPLGPEFARTITVGVISALKRTVFVQGQQFELLQTDAAINPGNSGGALVNSQGELIGINSAKIVAEEIEGINFAIPINTAKPIIEDLVKHGKVVRPFLGIVWVTDVNETIADQYGLPVSSGVIIEVSPNGPAQRAGLKNSDVITQLNGVKTNTFQDLRKEIEKHKIGDKIELKVIRAKKEQKITVTLGEAPGAQ